MAKILPQGLGLGPDAVGPVIGPAGLVYDGRKERCTHIDMTRDPV